ncbi:hypothetical protein SAMN05216382_2947 [Sphingomonas palmae]|uniref:Uncharacterized protein n=1 Tax=Sphingomonas palmae TaxID=1855283 RepID=A0A1H7U7F7_9SPHN|nr:hypothetical protein [Sphingomonas palmae]SEL92558.1 hypothetical protein SAMN05216382_2947 [Sphingomonas palmae]
MTRSLPFALLASAALFSAGMAVAQTPMTHATTAARTTTRTMTKTSSMKPAMATTRTTQSRTAAGHMVTTKTATGKSVTYDCSKAGNKTKQACKR